MKSRAGLVKQRRALWLLSPCRVCDAGHVVIAVFVKASAKEVPARERAIAEISRAVHDFFLFQAGRHSN